MWWYLHSHRVSVKQKLILRRKHRLRCLKTLYFSAEVKSTTVQTHHLTGVCMWEHFFIVFHQKMQKSAYKAPRMITAVLQSCHPPPFLINPELVTTFTESDDPLEQNLILLHKPYFIAGNEVLCLRVCRCTLRTCLKSGVDVCAPSGCV